MYELVLTVQDALSNLFASMRYDISFVLMQGVALIGMMCITIVCRGNIKITSDTTKFLGDSLGLTAFALFLLLVLDYWIGGGDSRVFLKYYLRDDLLFLAGFFGGWRGATYTAFFVAFGRILFCQELSLVVSLLDIAVTGYGAVIARKFFPFYKIEKSGVPEIGGLVLLKLFISVIPLGIIAIVVGHENYVNLIKVLVASVVYTCTISVFVFYTFTTVLRKEILYERHVYFDRVSKLPNRKSLQERLDQVFCHKDTAVEATPSVMFLVNVVNSKELLQDNDHDSMDNFWELIGKEISHFFVLKKYQSLNPGVYCFSESSLAVVLDGVDSTWVRHENIAVQLYEYIGQVRFLSLSSLRPKVTLGVVDIDSSEIKTSQWFLRGVILMESAWNDKVHYFDSKIALQVEAEGKIRAKIERWILQEEAPLWFQPKVDLKTMQCIGAEALLRAPRPDGKGFYSPFEIFAVAEKHYRLGDLEWAILQTTVTKLLELEKHGNARLNLSVNLTSISLQRFGFGSMVCELIRETGADPKRLIIEVAETMPIVVSEILCDNLEYMRAEGIQISLDDFGIAYSSLDLLSQLKFDELKIDYSMTSRLDTLGGRTAINLAVEGAQRYGALVVAEGIETMEQYHVFLAMGVQFGQGFLFEKAVPFESFLAFAQKTTGQLTATDMTA